MLPLAPTKADSGFSLAPSLVLLACGSFWNPHFLQGWDVPTFHLCQTQSRPQGKRELTAACAHQWPSLHTPSHTLIFSILGSASLHFWVKWPMKKSVIKTFFPPPQKQAGRARFGLTLKLFWWVTQNKILFKWAQEKSHKNQLYLCTGLIFFSKTRDIPNKRPTGTMTKPTVKPLRLFLEEKTPTLPCLGCRKLMSSW